MRYVNMRLPCCVFLPYIIAHRWCIWHLQRVSEYKPIVITSKSRKERMRHYCLLLLALQFQLWPLYGLAPWQEFQIQRHHPSTSSAQLTRLHRITPKVHDKRNVGLSYSVDDEVIASETVLTETEKSLTNEKTEDNEEKGLSAFQQVENYKCIFLGAGVGIWAVLPFTAFHYFIYQPQYTSLPQWEFDTYTGAIQGALFCLVYRYAVRDGAPHALSKQVKQSFVGVRTLSRIHVPMVCTALPLYCTWM